MYQLETRFARIMYCISIREGNSLPEGTATAAQQSRLFARRPAAEGKLLLRVYLPRSEVGHRVAQATALPSGGGAEAPFGVVAVADQVLLRWRVFRAVSYTHLTLPTIYSV